MTLPFASQHTTSFPELLQYLGASVLVSTYQAGQLIILRTQHDILNTHYCSLEKPMGIAANGERLTVGTGYQVLGYRNLPPVVDKVTGSLPHDACYLPRSIHITGDIDIHELGYADDGELWLVNTRMSCLCTLDPAYSVVPRWRPPFVSAYDLTDRCHLNGLAFRNGQPAFVTALGQTNSAGGWRANKASGGLLMNLADNRIIAAGLSMPHSPRWYRNKLWYLESGAGRLCFVNPDTGVQTVVAQLPGFTRGLDFAGRYAFVGLSQVRETAVFSGLPLTQKTSERHCGVWVIDIEKGETMAYVTFTGSVQEIFSVQLLPFCFPMILDVDDPLVRSSYALPDEAYTQVASPDPLMMAFEKATLQYRERNFEEAISGYREVLVQSPENLVARFHLGVALMDAERWQEAKIELAYVVERQSSHAEAHHCLGLCYAAEEHWEQALQHIDQALLADSHYVIAHLSRAKILLKLGRYLEGWHEYEWRLKEIGSSPYAFSQPCWHGEFILDKVLLVYTEHYVGDILQFARFLSLASKRCKTLVLACSETIRPLLSSISGVAEARVPEAIILDSFDYYCPMMSLPNVLGVTLENLPVTMPYISIPDYVSVPRLVNDELLRVGICWSGSEEERNDKYYSCSLQHWLTLLLVPNVAFYSLQSPISTSDSSLLKAHGVCDLEPELHDYARFAALIAQLDLVVSVDTSVVHLAGALNKPVWVLLGKNSDWRWLLDCDNSPWYPSMRLFRNNQPDDWQALIERVKSALIGWRDKYDKS